MSSISKWVCSLLSDVSLGFLERVKKPLIMFSQSVYIDGLYRVMIRFTTNWIDLLCKWKKNHGIQLVMSATRDRCDSRSINVQEKVASRIAEWELVKKCPLLCHSFHARLIGISSKPVIQNRIAHQLKSVLANCSSFAFLLNFSFMKIIKHQSIKVLGLGAIFA